MKSRTLTTTFVALWLLSAVAVPYLAGSLDRAGNFGSSFGAVSALFSGIALALAINSMLLQQRQSAEFERVTLASLTHHASAIKLIEQTLIAQADMARVAALSALIQQEELRTETLREWGARAGDESKYSNGIKAAARRIDEYREQLRKYVGD